MVHHGGAGTIAAGLQLVRVRLGLGLGLANPKPSPNPNPPNPNPNPNPSQGLPTMVVPFFGDQHLWGSQVSRLRALTP